jgi:hypothetical protein
MWIWCYESVHDLGQECIEVRVSSTPQENRRTGFGVAWWCNATRTYHREYNRLVSEEVVVQAREISTTTCDEIDGGLRIYAKAIAALNSAENTLALLLKLFLLCGEVL